MRLHHTLRSKLALTLAILIILDTCMPVALLALTGGPSQPEVQGFKSIEATNMVDIFTGDFNYNLPLFEIEGYPVNMSYSSNPRMDDEASWVGLGWTLNPGAVNREMRGMPDEFKDEQITKTYDMKNDFTVGGNFGVGLEVFGLKALNIKQGLFWNNKKGFGSETSVSASQSLGNVNASLSLSSNTQSGLDVGASIGLTKKTGKTTAEVNAGVNINSRQGLKAVSFGYSIKAATVEKARSEPAANSSTTPTSNSADAPETDNGDTYGSTNGGISHEMGGFSYFPTNPTPTVNESFSFHGTVGAEFFGGHPNLMLDGYVSNQRLARKTDYQRAYGYMYQAAAQNNKSAVLDMNRDGQMMYREDMPNVPLSYGTYDNFSVAGQGVGGSYRLYRNDVGMLHNGFHSNRSVSGALGIELGVGNLAHNGGDFAATIVDNVSEPWITNNNMRPVIKFTENERDYEGVYFKETSEKTVDDEAFNDKIGGRNPIFTKLRKEVTAIKADKEWQFQKNKTPVGSFAPNSNVQKTERAKRYSVFNHLTVKECAKVGLDKTIKSYPAYTANNAAECRDPSVITRPEAKDHHIGEISVTKSDGGRYVFGLPAYNMTQVESSFSCVAGADNEALIGYTPIGNEPDYKNKGRDDFYEAQTIPAYAHSYLLTGVLSDDYVDVTGDGITEDDLGNGVKFNYTQHSSKYKWRTPYAANKARLMQGMKTDKKDDKASIVYGEKEVWYMHSIESRNMVAQFYTSPRNDGFGVKDIHGVRDATMGLMKLDKVEIYSKSDLIKNGRNAVPIKTVHFVYAATAQELCQGVENSATSGGKLTLQKVYFTFGKNQKGTLNAYQFDYKRNATGASFKYAAEKVDRWGFHKEQPVNNFPTYMDYPYSLQNKVEADKFAGAWSLNKITLPSGGLIEVNYESDDYAYVQNKRAGQMFFLKGFAPNTTEPPSPNLYTQPSGIPFGFGTPNNYLVVDVADYATALNLSNATPPSVIQDLFCEDVKDIYFKAKVRMTKENGTYEFVTGYAGYTKEGIVYNNARKELYIPIKNINDGGGSVQPIALAGLQLLRLSLPDLAYSLTGNPSDVNMKEDIGLKLLLKGLVGFAAGLNDLIKGYTKDRIQRGWCQLVDVGNKNAWVRLANPALKKLGGGSRVKTIRISDVWTRDGNANSYGQKFTYTTVRNGKTISSGVASYEPALGGEENAMKQPLPYADKVKLAPDNSYYTETPIGESFFPSPGVGYSEVRVESTDGNFNAVGTGYTVSQFYTAKDFPTITDFTNIVDGTVKVKPDIISKLFKFNVVDQRGVSQGFVVETNDMHGKPKEEAIYNQNGAMVSATNYYYKVDDPNATVLHLNNRVDLIKPDGTIVNREMGAEMDVWQEMQEESSKMKNLGVAVNVESFLGFIFPIVVPIPLPIVQNSNKGIKTSITTKHIRRMGIVDKIVKTVDGSTQSTRNVAYDIETGDVILTQTENEFNDPLFNFTYPAHWAYEGMGAAYKNIGNLFKGVKFNATGEITEGVSNPSLYFIEGDELVVTNEATQQVLDNTYYFTKKNPNDPLRMTHISGNYLNGSNGTKYTIRVKRSGRRNKAAMPIGSVASLSSPVVGTSLVLAKTSPTAAELKNLKVIQSDAKEYSDRWRMRCAKDTTFTNCGEEQMTFKEQIINAYTSGTRGNWRGLRGFVHYNDRDVASVSALTNIRRNGTIPNFIPYWKKTSAGWAASSDSKWVRSDLVHQYDQRGNEIESSDANDIASSASFGFNGTQVVAVTANSMHQEMTYDSFEDYDFVNNCVAGKNVDPSKSFPFYKKTNRVGAVLDNKVSHTGNYSMMLPANQQYRITAQLNGNFCAGNTGTNTSATSLVQEGTNVSAGVSGSNNPEAVAAAAIPSPGGVTLTAGEKNVCTDCLPEFGLFYGKRYVMTVWVATQSSVNDNKRPLSMKVAVHSDGNSIPVTLTMQGPAIEGWQKLEGVFTTPTFNYNGTPNAKFMYFTFSNLNPELKGYIDDVRILPFNAKMKAYAYDWRSRRLMAELDENHYATFYEYDDEGQLVRVKRETESGVQTVKEARSYLKPQ